jgi:hypothetical protein
MDHSIPIIDIAALFGASSRARDLADQAIMAAALNRANSTPPLSP